MRKEPDILADLARLCTAPGYVHAIAHLCFRDSLVTFSGGLKAEDLRHLFSPDHLIRTEIATLVGFLVKGEIDYKLPPPATLGEYIEKSDRLLKELHDSMTAKMIASLDPAKLGDPNFNPLSQGEALREAIFYGGESAYLFQYRDFAPKKYADDDGWLMANKGFAIVDAQNVLRTVSRLQDKNVMATVRALKGKPPEEWTVLPGFTFSAQSVAEEGKLDRHRVERVLDAFALPAGEKNAAFNALNDFNATDAFPLIRKDRGDFILFHQYRFGEAIYQSPFYWMGADKAYVSTAMTNRGRFTEDFSRERLELVFGKANVFANVDVVGPKGDKAGEIDALVAFGNRAVVLQAKSKRLTLEARRGNDGQIRDDFKKSTQDAYDQGYECAQFLVDRSYRLEKAGVALTVPRNFKEIYILCVVSDHYPALAFQVKQFLKYKSDAVIQPPYVMDIFTLDAMTEMLESPLRLLSYLSQRTKYSERLMSPHELAILSYHLKSNLWLEDKYDLVMLHDDISADLDVAMAVRRDGVPGQRTPDGILTRLTSTALGRLVKQIETKPEPGTIELGFLLLTLAEDAVKATGRAIDRITSLARKDGKSHDVTIGISSAQTGLTIQCNSNPIENAGAALESYCHLRKYAEKADTWFGVCMFPDERLRFGVNLNFKWEENAEMDARTHTMQRPKPIAEVMQAVSKKKQKVGRNDPCPCGSGKKYKKCHLR